ncbi:MAG: hypothetical protein H6677_16930 [Candidatus Obscuribacterales bacterium]|nr:hypothetical protein [Cyanobacteria bacterium HKST-UBA01]MCB9469958.1 hypothetical protein [Candidatus Obscuribacterales bacterium]
MSPEKYFDLLRLSFLLPPGHLRKLKARDFLNMLRQNLPQALPYSWLEIFYETRLEVEEEIERTFIETWDTVILSTGYPGFYWGSQAPFCDGMVRFTGGWPQHSYNALSPDLLELQFDQSQIAREEPSLLPEIVCGFTAIARNLEAFYAAGYVLRNYLLENGAITFVIDVSETLPSYSDWWDGIPKTPWLTWFGADYKSLLNDSLSGCELVTESTEDGCLLRLGEFPVYNANAKKIYPRFPKEKHSSLALTHKLADMRSLSN